MSNQGDLFNNSHPLDRAFMAEHEANPHAYVAFRRFALEAVKAGRDHFSARMIWERLRWHTTVESDGDAWKLNNNWVPYYSRLFIEEHPEHIDLFQLRGRDRQVSP